MDRVLSAILLLQAFFVTTVAQPSPEVQQRIFQAIAGAGNSSEIDYSAFVNPFIGTGTLSLRFSSGTAMVLM